MTNWPLLKQNMHKEKCIYNENSPLAGNRSESRILLINAWPNSSWNDKHHPSAEPFAVWGHWVIDSDSDKQDKYPLANSPGISEPVIPENPPSWCFIVLRTGSNPSVDEFSAAANTPVLVPGTHSL